MRVARDGIRVCRAIERDGETGSDDRAPFDLVVSDLKLPGLDGREPLCLVREDRRLAGVSYVIFSSSNETSDIGGCLECGADAYVQKPFGFEEYLDCLQGVARWAAGGFQPSNSPPCAVTTPEPCLCGGRAA